MPRAALYTVLWSERHGLYELLERGRPEPLMRFQAHAQWVIWLNEQRTAAFQGRNGRFNLLKEARKRGGLGYWYAYRHYGQRRLKRYLGRTADLTFERLEAAAQAFADLQQVPVDLSAAGDDDAAALSGSSAAGDDDAASLPGSSAAPLAQSAPLSEEYTEPPPERLPSMAPEMLDAVETAIAAQEFERAAQLMLHLLTPYAFVSDTHSLQRWLSALPEPIVHAQPVLCFALAQALLCRSSADPEAVLPGLEALLQIAEDAWSMPEQLRSLSAVWAFRAQIARRRNNSEQAVVLARCALVGLSSDDSVWRSLCLNIVGADALRSGQVQAARPLLLETYALSELTGDRYTARAVTQLLADAAVAQGSLHLAAAQYRQALADARAQGDREDLAAALIGIATIAYEWNSLDVAEQVAQEAHDLGESLGNTPLLVQAALVLVRLWLIRAQDAEAQELLRRVLAQVITNRMPMQERALRMAQTQLQLAHGALGIVQQWYAQYALSNAALPYHLIEQEALLVTRFHLAQGLPDAALHVISPLLRAAQQDERSGHALYIQLLLAQVYAAQGWWREATRTTRGVLERAYSEGYRRLFLDEGQAVEPLLRAVLSQLANPPLKSYIAGLLRDLEADPLAQRLAVTRLSKLAYEPLSAQEERVLLLLVEGHTNPEIARTLVVSVNTIKVHLKHIYRKLKVRSRLEASEAARYLFS